MKYIYSHEHDSRLGYLSPSGEEKYDLYELGLDGSDANLLVKDIPTLDLHIMLFTQDHSTDTYRFAYFHSHQIKILDGLDNTHFEERFIEPVKLLVCQDNEELFVQALDTDYSYKIIYEDNQYSTLKINEIFDMD